MEANGQVDLSLAKPGDLLHNGNGWTIPYKGPTPDGDDWAETHPFMSADNEKYRQNGTWSAHVDRPSRWDILRVTRDGVQITPAVPPEPGKPSVATCPGFAPQNLDRNYCRNCCCSQAEHPEGCMLCGKQDSAPDVDDPPVITGPGIYRTERYDEEPQERFLAHIHGWIDPYWYGHVGLKDILYRWSTGGYCDSTGTVIDITGAYIPSPAQKILSEAYEHEEKGHFRHAVGTLFNGISELLENDKYSDVDDLLKAANPRKLSCESIVCIAAVTFAAASHLKERASFLVCRASDVVRSREIKDSRDVMKILAKYDA